jgi:hypothetical protein
MQIESENRAVIVNARSTSDEVREKTFSRDQRLDTSNFMDSTSQLLEIRPNVLRDMTNEIRGAMPIFPIRRSTPIFSLVACTPLYSTE